MAERTNRVIHPSTGKSKTKPEFAESLRTENIVKRFGQSGMWDHVTKQKPIYGDFSFATDLRGAMELVADATEAFMELPPEVREVAQNDPAQFLALMASEEGVEALEKAGMPIDRTEPDPEAPVVPNSSPLEPAREPDSNPAQPGAAPAAVSPQE